MMGKTNITIDVYVDSTGGVPDYASFELVTSISAFTINAVGQMQVQTVSTTDAPLITFPNADATLVVVMSAPLMAEGFIYGGGQPNAAVIGTTGETYVGGACREDFQDFSSYASSNNNAANARNQWYVRLHGSSVEQTKTPTARPTSAPSPKGATNAPSMSPTSNIDPDSNSSNNDDELSPGAAVGVSFAVIIVVCACLGGGYYYYTQSKKDRPLMESFTGDNSNKY